MDICKLKLDDNTVVNLKDKQARNDIENLAKNIYISDEDFNDIFNSTNNTTNIEN